MVELTLPQNSKIGRGKEWPALGGAKKRGRDVVVDAGGQGRNVPGGAAQGPKDLRLALVAVGDQVATKKLLARIEPAATDMNRRAPTCLQSLGEHHGLLDVPAAFNPVCAGHTNRYRPIRPECGTHGIKHFERKPHAMFESPSVLVVPAVRKR